MSNGQDRIIGSLGGMGQITGLLGGYSDNGPKVGTAIVGEAVLTRGGSLSGILSGSAGIVGTLSAEKGITGGLSGIGSMTGTLSGVVVTGEQYTGEYEFTPNTEEQTIEIQFKTAMQNITINPIPENYGLITWNGSSLTVS